MTSPTLPTLFLSHGSPMLAVEASAAGRFLDGLGTTIPRHPPSSSPRHISWPSTRCSAA